jgi:benzylsuccinate CoA-transferase BbsF subunit
VTGNGPLPLAKVRVADFTQWGAGPMTTRILADYGAEVIRVESMAAPDGGRLMWPLVKGKSGFEVSAWTSNYNANKRSITVNLTDPRGVALVYSLVRNVDIVADSFPPHVMKNWGLAYDELRRIKPAIITLSMPVGGNTGAYCGYRGFGNTIAAMSGFPSLMGFPGKPPIGTASTYTDFTSGPIHAATALLAALYHRNNFGEGQAIEVSQFESAVCFVGTALLAYLANGTLTEPAGNACLEAAPHGIYKSRGADRWCAIAIFSDEEWHRLGLALGNPHWSADDRFSTFKGRKLHEVEISRHLESWTTLHSPHEAMARLQEVGVRAAAVQNIADLLVDPQMQHRGHYSVIPHSEAGDMTYEEPIYKLQRVPARLRTAAPIMGQDNDHVLKEIVGLSEAEIDELISGRVVF